MSSEKKELLTVEVARAWLRVTKAERMREEAQTRDLIINRVLLDFVQRVRWGYAPQDAGDQVWRMWRSRNEPNGIKQLAAETLEGVGWVRPGKKGAQ
jgi:hypothetical protein